MAIRTLMEFIKNTKPSLNLGFSEGLINNVSILHYEINQTTLYFYTEDSHEFWIDITDFKGIVFDAIASCATNESEMGRCLLLLQQSDHFNVYLHNSEDKPLLNIYIVTHW